MRTSVKELEYLINNVINPKLGFPVGTKLWTSTPTRNIATVGMTYLYRCLGVWALHRIVNDGGGVTVILSETTARDFKSSLRAFISGLEYLNK